MRFYASLLLLLWPICAVAQDDLEGGVRRLIEVYSLVENRYADPVDPEQVFYQGVLPGMLRTLDPHSAFLDAERFASLKQMQHSVEKGFGSVVNLLPGRVIVLQTLPDSPSSRSGLSAGDEIVVMNGYPLSQFSIEQLVSFLGQSRQQSTEIMVQRPGVSRLIPMTLTPAEMADPSVSRAFLLRPGFGYVKVATFEGPTAEDLRTAIEDLGGNQLQGLILDMRGNPGGLVEGALQTASFFLEPGQQILRIRGREGPHEEVTVPPGFEPYKFRIAILIDNETASAAEIVAGALQDHDRATILGQPSYGKGIVQSVFDLSEGTAVALTTAKYLTPSGRSIQRPLENCELYALAACAEPGDEYQTDQGRVVRAGGGIEPDKIVVPQGCSPTISYLCTRFETVMEVSNSFFEFVQQYLNKLPEVTKDFEPSPAMLDDFQLFLSERRIRPDLSEWSATLNYIRSRLKQEVFNLRLGVAKGDEVELQRQAELQEALLALASE